MTLCFPRAQEEEDDGEGGEPKKAKVSRKARQSPVKYKKRTAVPFDSPGKEPLDADGLPKDKKVMQKEHNAWLERVRMHAAQCLETVKLRKGIEARTLNRILMSVCDEDPDVRQQLRKLGFMQQERHLAKMEVVRVSFELPLSLVPCTFSV